MKVFPSACLILYLILFCPLASCKKKNSDSKTYTPAEIDSLVNIGMVAYQQNPLSALRTFKQAGGQYEMIEYFDKAGEVYLNVAGIYEEYSEHKDSAMIFARNSLDNFLQGNDSMKIANLNKYYGYLLGINGYPTQGKAFINDALGYYKRTEFEEGVAVCHYNSARLEILDKRFSTADSLLDEAQKVWILNNDVSRLFLIHMLRLEMGMQTNNEMMIRSAIRNCDSLMIGEELPMVIQSKYNQLKTKAVTDHISADHK